jgi:hypothetical protein
MVKKVHRTKSGIIFYMKIITSIIIVFVITFATFVTASILKTSSEWLFGSAILMAIVSSLVVFSLWSSVTARASFVFSRLEISLCGRRLTKRLRVLGLEEPLKDASVDWSLGTVSWPEL